MFNGLYRLYKGKVHVGWPLSKDVLQGRPGKNFGKKSRMKKSRRKRTITWEGEVRKDSAKSLRTKNTGCSGNILE